MPVGEPNESDDKLPILCDGSFEPLFMMTVRLTDLSFDPIPVDRMLKSFLGHADKNLHWRTMVLTCCL